MKVTCEEVLNRQTVLHIELDDEDLGPYLDRGYRRVVQRTLIPGFRKGKAPRRIVEQFLGRQSLISEVLDSMLPEVTGRAVTAQELEAAGLPQIELLNMDPFTLKATVPLTPDVDLGAYRDIRIPFKAEEVTEEAIQSRLEQLRQSMATWEPVERSAQMGDTVTVRVVGKVEGRAVLSEEDAVFLLDEEATRPAPEFAQHLVGMGKDQPKEFTVNLPQDLQDLNLAGQEAVFSVTISEIKGRVLSPLDDDFARSVGDGYESLDALHQQVEKDLETETEQSFMRQCKEQVLQALVQGATIVLPPLLVEHELEHIQDDRARVLSQVNVRLDDYLRSIGKTDEELRSETQEEAIERLKRTFVLSKVAELEGVEVADDAVDERVQAIVSSASQRTPRQRDSGELRDSVRRTLVVDKTLDRLVAIAKGEASPGSEFGGSEPGPELTQTKQDATQAGVTDGT